MRSRSEVKKDAKRKLNAYWNIPVVVTIAVFLIEAIVSGIFRNASLYYVINTLATAFTGVFTTMLFLRIAKNDNLEKVTFSWMNIPSEKLIKCVVYSLIMALGTTLIQYVGEWLGPLAGFLLAIFVAVLEVYLSFSVLIILDTDVPILNAIKSSMDLIEGRFWDVVIFSLSFIPWFLLGVVTFGIGLVWIFPYFGISFANYYLELKYNKQLR